MAFILLVRDKTSGKGLIAVPDKPTISIIIPTFNAELTLRSCLDSVCHQSYSSYEVLLIDGNSTDRTLEIIEDYKGYGVKWISESDTGIYDAMNKGVAMASGEWLYFLGSDDQLCENALSAIADHLYYPKVHFVYGDVFFKHSGRRYGFEYTNEKLAERVICHQAIFAHRSLFVRCGLFDQRYKSCADYAFMIKAFGLNPNHNFYTNEPIAVFDERGFSAAHLDLPFLRIKHKLCKTHLGIDSNNEAYFEHLSKEGNHEIEAGSMMTGIKMSIVSVLLGRNKMRKLLDVLYVLKKRFFRKS